MKQSLATHTTIAEMVKERTDNRKFLEALQVRSNDFGAMKSRDNYVFGEQEMPFIARLGAMDFVLLYRYETLHRRKHCCCEIRFPSSSISLAI